MTDDMQEYNIGAIYDLLLAAFTGETLQRLCRRTSPLKPILARFGPGQGLDDMADEVVEYCEKNLLLGELLTAVSRENPEQYALFHPNLGRSAPPPVAKTATALSTARTWPMWYWMIGAVLALIPVAVAVWWIGLRPEPGPEPQPTETSSPEIVMAPSPIVEFFRVFPSEVQPGTPVSISWHVQNAESIEVRPGGIFRGKPTYEISDLPRGDQLYELYINGTPTPIESRLVRYWMAPAGAPDIDEFSVTPGQVVKGVTEKITLKWDSPDADRVAIAGIASDLDPVWEITLDPPTETTEYKLVAENEAGRRSRTIQVLVVTPTPNALTLTPTPTGTAIALPSVSVPADQARATAAAIAAVRPALLVQGGQFSTPPTEWTVLDKDRAGIVRTLQSVGRIEVRGDRSMTWYGTGFVAGPDVVMTARSVAEQLCEQDESKRWAFKSGITAQIDFGEELEESPTTEYELTEIIGVHPELDLALFRVERASSQGNPLPEPLTLASRAPRSASGRRVYVVGYPASDPRVDSTLMTYVMSHIFNVKRLQPGQVIELSDQARTFSHDCFTLGGNSGSPVVDLETFQVLGLHFAGRLQPDRQTKINEAVALWHLIDDPLLQENRINFD
jgi:hypothetical protein